jgi:hypothetical protein
VRFALTTADYQVTQTVRARLEPGEKKVLKSPIARPGHMSVQPSLGSPQGLVSIDGRPLGSSPIRNFKLTPGRHKLEVFAASDPTIALAETTVEIAPARETIITFDLTGQRDLSVRYRDLSP